MDRLEAMSIVLAVAEAGSLSAAARLLNTPAATASRKISELEAHLRTKLFDRTAQRLALTAAGSSYVAASKRILADLTEAERAASGEYSAPTGELIITGPVNLGRHLIPILAEFLRLYPKIDVHLVLTDRLVSLPEDHVDVALRVGVLPDSRLIALRVGSVRRQPALRRWPILRYEPFSASPRRGSRHGWHAVDPAVRPYRDSRLRLVRTIVAWSVGPDAAPHVVPVWTHGALPANDLRSRGSAQEKAQAAGCGQDMKRPCS